jgi:flagellar biosynthetic protein FlhB
MPEKPFQDRTEPATPKKREEARRKGQVAKSREIVSVAVLGTGILYLFLGGESMAMTLGNTIKQAFAMVPELCVADLSTVVVFHQTIRSFLAIVLPLMLVLSAAAILASMVQTGFVWSVTPLAPKASKIDPIQGMKRIFSKRAGVELGKSLAKMIIVGWAAFSTLQDEVHHLTELAYQSEAQIMSLLGNASLKVATRCCTVIVLLAVLDYLYQRWEYEQNLKMTKQEVKEEFKQTEGDPLVRSRIRSIQREMARRRMMEEVKTADVVITNPQHLSIALRYDSAAMTAPTVVAKGADKIAFKIREVAREYAIPMVENKILAQNLYRSVDVGQEIPEDLYRAVAEILAYVYGLKRKVVS